ALPFPTREHPAQKRWFPTAQSCEASSTCRTLGCPHRPRRCRSDPVPPAPHTPPDASSLHREPANLSEQALSTSATSSDARTLHQKRGHPPNLAQQVCRFRRFVEASRR